MSEMHAAASAFDDSQKRWATFLDYLKVNIGLTGGLLGAFALVFSDPSKIPSGFAKWSLATVAIATLLSLLFSLVSIIWINRLVIDRSEALEAKAIPSVFTRLDREAGWVTLVNFLGLIFLALSGIFIVVFIFLRLSLVTVSLPTQPTATDELRQDRQQQSRDVQRLQDILSTELARIANRLDPVVIQPKDQPDLAHTSNDVISPLQARISDLEKKQISLELELQQLRASKQPIKDRHHRR